jgi:hypothetical protein
MRLTPVAVATVLLLVMVARTDAQVLSAEMCTAPGFTLEPSPFGEPALQPEQAVAYGFRATRAQPDYPRWAAGDSAITLGCGWSPNPSADLAIRMLLQAPQDPGTDNVTSRSEPAGKEAFKGGVLLLKKWTYIDVGISTEPDLVTYAGQWYGAHAGGILAIGVDNVLGSPEAIRGWIGEVISKASSRP